LSSQRRTIRCDEGEAYARKLKEAGVKVDAVRYNGTIHDFMLLNALRHEPSTEAAIEQTNEGVRLHLSVVSN
jgi:acetyl esterase